MLRPSSHACSAVSDSERILIVNADDFGHSAEVNAGVVRAHEKGIVTSTSLMVRRPAVEEAAAYARSRPQLAVGLHVELGEWRFIDGAWVSAGVLDDDRVAAEVEVQLERFAALVGRDPTHLDSHQHAHLREPALSAVVAAGRRLRVPVRHVEPRIRYLGWFYGQTDTGEPFPEGITAENLCRIVRLLDEGITELGCHPAVGSVPGTSYSTEREQELATLCDPSVRTTLADTGVELRSFAGLVP